MKDLIFSWSIELLRADWVNETLTRTMNWPRDRFIIWWLYMTFLISGGKRYLKVTICVLFWVIVSPVLFCFLSASCLLWGKFSLHHILLLWSPFSTQTPIDGAIWSRAETVYKIIHSYPVFLHILSWPDEVTYCNR